MNIISAEKTPGTIGSYPQGFEVSEAIYASGQIPVNLADGSVAEDITGQARQGYKNVGVILEVAGNDFSKISKTTCFLADIGDFATFNEVYAKYFTSEPARNCVAIKTLPKGVLCEIEVTAIK